MLWDSKQPGSALLPSRRPMQTLPKVKQGLLLFAESGAAHAICDAAHPQGQDAAGAAQLLPLPQPLVTRPEAAHG